MSGQRRMQKNNQALNVFISYDLKKALLERAEKSSCSIAEVVRLLLQIGLPILDGICESRQLLITEQVEFFRQRDLKEGSSRGTDRSGRCGQEPV